MDYPITKDSLRKQLKAIRKGLGQPFCRQASVQLVDQFHRFVDANAISTIHIFLSMPAWNEPDTSLLIQSLQHINPNIRFVVPVVVAGEVNLRHALLADVPELEENFWGIPEPRVHTYVKPDIADLVIVPFLGIDPLGNRIGFGKGYYDRFLSMLPPRIQKIAYGYEAGRIRDFIPVEVTDIRMDGLITETGFYQFAR